jgi:hypothetical protein
MGGHALVLGVADRIFDVDLDDDVGGHGRLGGYVARWLGG